MNIGVLIEVAIGILFVWILLAAITSAVQDWISQWLKWRATMLEESIRNILADDELTQQFYDHPLIKGLHSKGGKRKPSEIPNKQFASVVFDMLIKAGTKESVVQENEPVYQKVKASINALKEDKFEEAAPAKPPREAGFWQKVRNFFSRTQKKLAAAKTKDLHNLSIVLDTLWIDLEEGDRNLGQARVRLENWFDNAMKRLGGAYKRRAQLWSLIIGIALAFALNADSLAIANKLWSDPLVREALVAQANQFQLPDQTEQKPEDAARQYLGQLQSLSIPLGWTPDNTPARLNEDGTVNKGFGNEWALKIGGILLSGMAAAQGAPFWFDIMKKILSARSGGGGGGSGEPAKKEKEEGK